MDISPAADLYDHRMDFIALDGSVALRLDFDYASEVVDDDDVATLAWGVCEQPWQAGDLLMLRMASGIPDDGVQATSDQECLTAASGQASTPTAEPELTVTATPVPTLTPTPTATPTP